MVNFLKSLTGSESHVKISFVLLVQQKSTTETRDRTNGLGQDMLSMYDQDDLLLLVFAAIIVPLGLGFVCRFLSSA